MAIQAHLVELERKHKNFWKANCMKLLFTFQRTTWK